MEERLANSLARPGGNITGLTVSVGPEIEGKRIELLKETLPGAARVAYLGTNEDCEGPSGKSVRAAAPVVGLTMVLAAHTPLNTLMHSPCSAASPPMLCSSPSDYLWTSTRLSRNYRLFLDDNCVGSCHIQESLRIFNRGRHLG